MDKKYCLWMIDNDIETGDYNNSKKLLESIRGFQTKYGSEILPSDEKIKAEIIYGYFSAIKSLSFISKGKVFSKEPYFNEKSRLSTLIFFGMCHILISVITSFYHTIEFPPSH